MTEDLDPELQWIRGARPEVIVDPALLHTHREKLMTAVIEPPAPLTSPGQPRRRRRPVIFVAPVAAVLLAAAGWTALRDQTSEAAAFACVADGVVNVLPNDGTSPIEACRAAWESGAMSSGVPSSPDLVACVSGSGAIEVIEASGADPCGAAGKETWQGLDAYEDAGAAIRSIRVGFHDRYKATGGACATEQDWRDALGDGLDEWTVKTDDVQAGRRCFDVGSIDPVKRTILLVDVPGDDSIGCDPRTGC